MPSADDTLTFEVVSGRLNDAITLLASQHGELLHRAAWQVLTAEAERRRAGAAAAPIHLRRGAFDELPVAVRGMLDVRFFDIACPHCGTANRVPTKDLERGPLTLACRSCEREVDFG